MDKKEQFTIDGVSYNVHVTKLVRKFSVMDTSSTGRTLSGEMYREIVGTFYNYSMTVSPNSGDPGAMDAFWEAISKPVASHVCVFPYGQKTLSQKMYITSGEQDLTLKDESCSTWGEITIEFVAMGPKVKA